MGAKAYSIVKYELPHFLRKRYCAHSEARSSSVPRLWILILSERLPAGDWNFSVIGYLAHCDYYAFFVGLYAYIPALVVNVSPLGENDDDAGLRKTPLDGV